MATQTPNKKYSISMKNEESAFDLPTGKIISPLLY
jgi:hypothetical protein